MVNEILLSRNDVIQMVNRAVDSLINLELAGIINQYSRSWIRYNGDTDSFVWTGGEKPTYLPKLVDAQILDNPK